LNPVVLRQIDQILSTASADTSGRSSVEGTTRNSTAAPLLDDETERLAEIEREVRHLFWRARDEVFEDGVGSAFGRQLNLHVSGYGIDLMSVLESLYESSSLNEAVLAEALVVLAHIDDPLTQKNRLSFALGALDHESATVRDAAGLALAVLDDATTAAQVREAARREPVAELRVELGRVADLLEH